MIRPALARAACVLFLKGYFWKNTLFVFHSLYLKTEHINFHKLAQAMRYSSWVYCPATWSFLSRQFLSNSSRMDEKRGILGVPKIELFYYFRYILECFSNFDVLLKRPL